MKLAPTSLREWLQLPLRVAAALAFAALGGIGLVAGMTWMPGASQHGARPPMTVEQQARQERLRGDVTHLATSIGERNMRLPGKLEDAGAYVEQQLAAAGWSVTSMPYLCRGVTVRNLVAEKRGVGRPDEIVLLGAHYDSVERSGGADDNASGVAVLLETARALQPRRLQRTVRLVAFVNEEPPWFRGPMMGSRVAARQFAERGDRLLQVLVLDAVGYFCDDGCQRYPPLLDWFLPATGDFVAFVARTGDWLQLREVVGLFRTHATLPSEGLAAPRWVPGIDYSDHAEFWNAGYPGILITDAPTYRNDNYHRQSDTVDTVDFERLTRVADGVVEVVAGLAGTPEPGAP